MRPYYEDDAVTLYHGDAREFLPTLAAQSVDAVITDPPYVAQVHTGARSRTVGARSNALVTFAAWTEEDLRSTFDALGEVVRRWVVATMAWDHAVRLHETPPSGLRFVRLGVWVKPNSAPQLTGDRPATGWEAVAILHSVGGRMTWNGGGKRAVWTVNRVDAVDHPTAKPLALFAEFVRLFTDPDEVVLDPFAGSGTTLVAAKNEGRRAIGIEADESYCEIAAKRLTQDVLDFTEEPA